jgi:hypothetical protein
MMMVTGIYSSGVCMEQRWSFWRTGELNSILCVDNRKVDKVVLALDKS